MPYDYIYYTLLKLPAYSYIALITKAYPVFSVVLLSMQLITKHAVI